MNDKIGDLGTRERRKRGEVYKDTINNTTVARVKNPTMYHTMLRRNIITVEQFYTADELRNDYDIGIIGYSSCEYREATQGGKRIDFTEKQLHHRQKFYKAFKTLNKQEQQVIEKIIIDDKPVSTKQTPSHIRKANMLFFKQSLDKLKSYYGF